MTASSGTAGGMYIGGVEIPVHTVQLQRLIPNKTASAETQDLNLMMVCGAAAATAPAVVEGSIVIISGPQPNAQLASPSD